MKIGDIILPDKPVLLAPMEDVTNLPFRKLCKEYGADLMYTEFVSSDALIRDVNKTKAKLELNDIERPVAIQIYGKEVDVMVEAAKIAEQANPEIIDINFGCPVKKVAMKGAGSGMLRDVPKLLAITEACAKACKKPVTVKTRLGWDDKSKIIVDLAEKIQDAGAKALTIHGRTRAQMYSGEADWTLIGEVKNNPRMHIPIIGNGDIDSPQKAKLMFDQYGVDAIMVGRATVGKPWIFRDIKHYFKTGEILPEATIKEQIKYLKYHLSETINWLDERRGILHMRRHMAVSFKGLRHFKQTRIKLLQSNSFEEICEIFSPM